MPRIGVLYWNIQNFGDGTGYRARQSQIQFIARAVLANQADILCIQEVKQNAIANLYLSALQNELNSLPAPYNNWYFDWIKGALAPVDGRPANYPFSQAADLAWDSAHHEGYAVFWNQNISKFTVQAAPPIRVPGGAAVANSQSEQCRMQGRVGFGVPATYVPLPGVAVPGGGLTSPGVAMPYIMPAGSNIPGHGVIGVATPMAAGTLLPINTVVGPHGIMLNAQTYSVYPVVVPGNYTLTEPLNLPPAGATMIPANALSLAMFGRGDARLLNGDIAAGTANFQPGVAYPWDWVEFTRGAAAPASRMGCRRPAYLTIKANRPALAAAAQLLPITVYHAPSAAPASNAGMQRSAYVQPMYQAYDWGAGNWIDCNNALIGGDYNVGNGLVAYPYQAFTGAFGGAGFGGGANCTMAIANPAPLGGTMSDNPLNKSIVALTNGVGGPPRYSANRPDFRSMAIDNIFYRGLAGGVVAGNTLLLDLLAGVSVGGGALTGGPVQNCLNTPNMVNVQTSVYVHHAQLPLPNLVDSTATLHDMNAGAFGTQPDWNARNTGARRAAEFVNLFVSDHLPAAIQFNM